MVQESKFPLCPTSELCCNRSIANFQEKTLFQWFGRLRDGTARANGRVGVVRDLTDRSRGDSRCAQVSQPVLLRCLATCFRRYMQSHIRLN
jgi:hypothetical protein